jgi:hypothetical protein
VLKLVFATDGIAWVQYLPDRPVFTFPDRVGGVSDPVGDLFWDVNDTVDIAVEQVAGADGHA